MQTSLSSATSAFSASPVQTHGGRGEGVLARQAATVGGTCFSGGAPTKRSPCTVVLTTSLSTLGVKPGAGLYDITGLSTY